MQQPTLRSSAGADIAAHNGVRLTAADREAIMKAQRAESVAANHSRRPAIRHGLWKSLIGRIPGFCKPSSARVTS